MPTVRGEKLEEVEEERREIGMKERREDSRQNMTRKEEVRTGNWRLKSVYTC